LIRTTDIVWTRFLRFLISVLSRHQPDYNSADQAAAAAIDDFRSLADQRAFRETCCPFGAAAMHISS
jgi:hypothetical protein